MNDWDYQFSTSHKDINDYIINSSFTTISIQNNNTFSLVLWQNILLNYLTDLLNEEFHCADAYIADCYNSIESAFITESELENDFVLSNSVTVYEEKKELIDVVNSFLTIWQDYS